MKIQDICLINLPPSLILPEEVIIKPGAVTTIQEMTNRFLGEDVLVVADQNTFSAVEKTGSVAFLQEKPYQLHLMQNDIHADMDLVDEIQAHCIGISGLIAVGGGTINDIVKMAASRLELPYIVVGTAASMNGYASGIAALIENGLKTTQASVPPKAIILDTDVLKAAPPNLMQAGVGDLISKPVSTADYWLGGEMDECEYLTVPGKIANHAVNSVMEQTAAIAKGNNNAYHTLAKALVLSGVSMVAAGSSNPASGGEHLISHLWDMQALTNHTSLQLHGAQVGIASCISAALYQRIIGEENPSIIDAPTWETEQERIKKEHSELADIVLPQAQAKHKRIGGRLEILNSRWNKIREGLQKLNIPEPQWFHDILQSVAAPDKLDAISQTKENGLRTLLLARDIRSRYTVLDLAFELGILPKHAEDVLEEALVL